MKIYQIKAIDRESNTLVCETIATGSNALDAIEEAIFAGALPLPYDFVGHIFVRSETGVTFKVETALVP